MPKALVVSLLLLGGLLTGCGDDGGREDEDGAQGTTTSSSAQPSSPPSTLAPTSPADDGGDGGDGDDGGDEGTPAPPFPADTRPDTAQASADATGNVTAIRIGHHDGFDRVVFEFEGRGTPGWDVRYVDQPTRQGSGEAVDLAGDAAVQVAVSGVGYPPDTGVTEYAGPQRLAAGDTEIVTEVFFDGTFEGITAALVGTQTQAPFRVYLLDAPTRIVLEVAEVP